MVKVDSHRLATLLGKWETGTGPLYAQLARAVAHLITSGQIRDDTVLPAERPLAATLAVSRGTVVNAYRVLENDGHVERRQGSGTRVHSLEVPGPRRQHQTAPLLDDESLSTALLQAVPENLLDLPAELSAAAALAAQIDVDFAPEGMWATRRIVADHVSDHGLATEPGQVLISNGTQHACSLTVRALCRSGDVVLTEALT